MYGQEQNIREQILEQYSADVEKLLRYLPWLKKSTGDTVESFYEGDEETKGTLLKIPVFDSTLLSFVKDAEKTQFVTKNYPYVYTRNRIRSHEDERRLMRTARIQDIDLFKGIISKYVLEGKRRPAAWRDAVEEAVFTTALECLNELFFGKGVQQPE
ncbi:MAG: hypothetical protein J5518_01255 [Lachnospiraceae bacterium]|nr:hypothetical protein [Lachnospiraceae bacterium]